MPRAVIGINGPHGNNPWPDYRCDVTAKMAEAWVEDEAIEAFGDDFREISITTNRMGITQIDIHLVDSKLTIQGMTRVDACINMVKKIKPSSRKRR